MISLKIPVFCLFFKCRSAMLHRMHDGQGTTLDRLLGYFHKVEPGEWRCVMLFFTYAFLMMVSYYILKTIREPLLLSGSSAEFKSYAYAVIALILLAVIPLYGALFRRVRKLHLTRYVTVFFLLNLVVFYLLGRSGADIGFAYYVWVGIFNLLITAQFWAFAADSLSVEAGKRLFPLIMIGATLGSLLAPSLSASLFAVVGPWVLMLVSMGVLALTLPLVARSKAAVPPQSASLPDTADNEETGGVLGGLALVFSDRFLILLAMLMLLLNWVNTSGEYILAELVVSHADAAVAASPAADKSALIAEFYGNFYFVVNLLTAFLQVFAVARVIQWIGVRGAVLVLPLIAMVGYGLVVFVPVFSLVRLVKLMENATDYSLMNTTRHALYLPLTRAHKYQGKTTIETIFWRFGDLAQAASIYAGLHWFGFGIEQFALFNMGLSMLWLAVAWRISRRFAAMQPDDKDEQSGEDGRSI